MNITIILPCAGEGSRLNLGYPKELFEIRKGQKLIDFSIFHILEAIEKNNLNIKISVVITPKKEAVFDYVKKKLPTIEVNKVYFNNKYREWPGSVFSASNTFSDNNLVLLPDSFLSLSRNNQFCSENGKSLIEIVQKQLELFNAVFGYIKSVDKNKLQNLGAMCTKNNKIVLFKDKPKKNLEFYNSFWGCYGFKKDYGKKLYDFLYKSVFNTDISTKIVPTFNMGGFPLYSFYDLGTWMGIDKFLSSKSNRSSSISNKT